MKFSSEVNAKQHVRLRKKELKNGHARLYLDIYFEGRRYYEWLKHLTLIPEKSLLDKQKNKDTIIIGESIRSKRDAEIINGHYGVAPPHLKDIGFIEYFTQKTDHRKEIGVDHSAWLSTLKHLKLFIGDSNIKLKDVDEVFIEKFKDYLLYKAVGKNGERLVRNTAHHYFNRVKHCFKLAFKEKIIQDDPASRVPYIEQESTKREYLTENEVKSLANTPCRYPALKRAFLFGVLTGLRWSDILHLHWKHIEIDGEKWTVKIIIRKTKEAAFLPISKQAIEFLGIPKNPDERVFSGLSYSTFTNLAIKEWCLKAKIVHKHITFHSSRHTFATLLLNNGVSLEVLQKLLLHNSIKTTQVYAKIIDSRKNEAVEKMPQLLII